jgi:transposase
MGRHYNSKTAKILTEDLIETMGEAIENGCSDTSVASILGIHRNTFNNWKEAGKKIDDSIAAGLPRRLKKLEKQKYAFYITYKQAKAKLEKQCIGVVKRMAMEENNSSAFRAATYLLEKKFYKEYGNTIDSQDGINIIVTVKSKKSEDEDEQEVDI